MHETGCSGLVHWDDPEGWDEEGGGITAACLCVEKKKFEEVKGLEEKGLKVALTTLTSI